MFDPISFIFHGKSGKNPDYQSRFARKFFFFQDAGTVTIKTTHILFCGLKLSKVWSCRFTSSSIPAQPFA